MTDDHYCENCGRDMSIPPELEPTVFCNDCAHVVAELMTVQNTELREALRRLLDTSRRIDESNVAEYCDPPTLSAWEKEYDAACNQARFLLGSNVP